MSQPPQQPQKTAFDENHLLGFGGRAEQLLAIPEGSPAAMGELWDFMGTFHLTAPQLFRWFTTLNFIILY